MSGRGLEARPILHGRTVQLQTPGGSMYELRPLDAAKLSGDILAAVLAVINEDGQLGTNPDRARVVLWKQMDGDLECWRRCTIDTERDLARELHSLKKLGIPYQLTIDLALDPLRDPSQEEPQP